MTSIFTFPGRSLMLPDIVRAENCSIFDAVGNQYLDMESGVWCMNLGHRNQDVNNALKNQLDAIAHVGFCYSSGVVERAGSVVLDLVGHIGGRCTFLCSGSEAVEYGIRTIRSITSSPKILTMHDSYFGAYGEAAVKQNDLYSLFDWSQCELCESDKCGDGCPAYADIPFEEIGAFLFEPGSSSGFVRFPPSKLINRIAGDVSNRDGLVMVNEVTTGFGRTGKWFGFQHYELQPDIVAMGKAIGNGYPVSAVSMNERVIDFLGGVPIPYAQSHMNDPLGAVVAEAVITTIEKNQLIEHAQEISKMLFDGLYRILSQAEILSDVRGRGLMAALVIAELSGKDIAEELQQRLIRRGIIVDRRPGTNILRIDPAMTIDKKDVGSFLAILKQELVAAAS